MSVTPSSVPSWQPPALAPGILRQRIGTILRSQPWQLLAAVIAIIASGACVAAGPSILRYAVDDGLRAGDSTAIAAGTSLYLLAAAAGGLLGGWRSVVMAGIGQEALHRLRHDSVAGLLRLDLGDYERADRGDLQSRFAADVEALTDATMDLFPQMLGYAIAIAGGLLGIALLSPLAAGLALIALPPSLIAGRWLQRRSQVLYPAYRQQVAQMSGLALESVEGTATIQSFVAQEAHNARLRESNRDVVRRALATTSMRNRFYPSLSLTQAAVTAAILIAVSWRAIDGQMTVGTAAGVVLGLGGMLAPIAMLTGQLDGIFAARASLVRVLELAAIPAASGGSLPLPEPGDLVFANVSYAYTPGRPVLEDVSLTIHAGERFALVGATGSGKSTIGRLATGLARPATGSVTFGGVDLASIAPVARRQAFMLLPQETFIAAGTIATNARLANPAASDTDIDHVVDQLGLRAWVDSLPRGIHSETGPGGSRLSSGERQLVSLIRIVAAQPAVIVLDESTSSLDDAMERQIAAAIDRAAHGRTLIIVAHRPATAARCDRIGVIEGGRLVAIGAHDDLVSNPAYARTWRDRAQAGETPPPETPDAR